MDNTPSMTYNLIFRDYIGGKDYPIVLTSEGDAVAASMEVADKLNGYGLYSLIVTDEKVGKHFRLYAELEDAKEARIMLVDSNTDELRAQEVCEYSSQFQAGFWFYKNAETDTVRIALEDGSGIYVSAPYMLEFCKEENMRSVYEQELIGMAQFVYERQPLLLTSVFQKSPLSVFIDKNSRIQHSIDTRLALIDRSLMVYRKQFNQIARSLKFKLREHQHIDRIDKLTKLSPEILTFIARNPQYLVEVKKKKGIHYNGKVYLPEKTMVSKNVEDYGTYENCYILSFLKMLGCECERMKLHLDLAQRNAKKRMDRARLKSQREDFESLYEKYKREAQLAKRLDKNAKRLFLMYDTAFKIKDKKHIKANVSKPNMTAVFRQLPEYNVYYNEVFVPWFEYGIHILDACMDDVYDTFTTAVSNPSTTYELYIVSSWIDYFIENGYQYDERRAQYAGVHEKESRYSDNAYQFTFTKSVGETVESVALYYSPSVYLPKHEKNQERYVTHEYNVDDCLYRRTKHSVVSREDNETNGEGAHYEPDFIIKYERDDIVRYVMADAKHKDYKTVVDEDIPELLYKYIESIKPLKLPGKDIKVAGLCAIYHSHSYENEDMLDAVDYFEYNQELDDEPFTKLMYMNALDEECNWHEIFERMLLSAKNYGI